MKIYVRGVQYQLERPEKTGYLTRTPKRVQVIELCREQRTTLTPLLGRVADAEAGLRTALILDPRFVPALDNLADLLRAQGRDAEILRWGSGVRVLHPKAMRQLLAEELRAASTLYRRSCGVRCYRRRVGLAQDRR